MKIVKILGGLGNQMFQYALYLALKKHFHDEKIMIDTSCFIGYPLHNGFELDKIFSLNTPVATWWDRLKVGYPYHNYRCWQIGKYIMPNRKTMCVESKDFTYDNSVLTQAGDRYFDGYWQHEEYFCDVRSVILKKFAFPPTMDERNRALIEKLSHTESVSLHIRRGDYVNHHLFRGICDLDYYKRAVEYMEKQVTPHVYCIFSNDIEWCETHLRDLLPNKVIIYVDWNKGAQSFVDMQLMSLCSHNIIANSSFSWWGAWLNCNPYKVVIVPQKWLNIQIEDPIPNSWIRI